MRDRWTSLSRAWTRPTSWIVSYGDIMRENAQLRGLPRSLLLVPLLTPHLSGLWLALVIPVRAVSVARWSKG